ncbi:ABC transporter ATP-binding protein [Haloarcula nitratireducens]|uniref:ABC-type D-xylose/L-arabinose transporter n=1 Tax=Haloarcula nitratireducens TaxID=2487749 RepID=A0AAW4P716_9EURY|nr:ABC transporter ATP-binding protein [Halomicroarcula nitratireducens]MBX0293796.1 ABC transporter ATP-binding protein [Halomicroarcula nitratireducens]
MANLTLDDVTKIFHDDDEGEIVAVDEVSVDIQDGEFLCVVGPSGCGKSTTLRMIAGLEDITSGEIRLGDDIINDQPPAQRNVAMVFQSYALYPHMSVRQNMAFGLEQSTKLSDDEIDERVTDATQLLGIHDLIDRKPGELSGGQQQRVALGRAIVRDPEVFLMDEPLANLDAKLRSEMRTELQHLQEDLDVTTVYVTHDQTEAMTMSDRIAILNDGRLQQAATPLECYHEPNNLFVAGFIGEPSMNFFEADRRGSTLVTDHFEYELSERTVDELGDHTDVTLGVRPEDVEVIETASGRHDYDAVVDVVEPRGNENTVHLTFDGSEESHFIATVEGMRDVEGGDRVTVRFPEEAIHVFDSRSGEAVRNRNLDSVEKVQSVV